VGAGCDSFKAHVVLAGCGGAKARHPCYRAPAAPMTVPTTRASTVCPRGRLAERAPALTLLRVRAGVGDSMALAIVR
jgi:hypothetical protein